MQLSSTGGRKEVEKLMEVVSDADSDAVELHQYVKEVKRLQASTDREQK